VTFDDFKTLSQLLENTVDLARFKYKTADEASGEFRIFKTFGTKCIGTTRFPSSKYQRLMKSSV
jgi:hypothetical protein